MQGSPAAEHDERVRRALDDVGLDPERFLERYPHQLSGGQRQRVAIAAALVLEPDGLICDEPVSMLDASVRAQILAVLVELQRRRELALLFITHDLSLAWSLCDRIAVMYLGRVVEQGTAVDVIERPQHPYTQALVDAIPVPAAGGGGRRELLGGELPDADRRCRPDAASTRAARGASSPATRSTRRCLAAGAPDQLAACLLHDPSTLAASGRWLRTRRSTAARLGYARWREIAGPVGLLEPGPRNAITDVPGVRVGHSQAASGEPTGVTVVAPPSLPAPAGTRGRQRDGRAHRADRDRRARVDRDARSTCAARTRSGPSTTPRSAPRGAARTTIVLPVVGECDDGWRADSRTVVTDDVDARARGSRARRSRRAASAPAPG